MRFGEDSYENNFLDDFSGYGGYGGLSTAAPYTPPAATYTAAPGPAPYRPPALTPEFLQQLQQGAALAGSSPLFNAAGGLSTLQPGTLNPLDPLYDYAKTAPILSLKGDNEFENLNFQALPDTNYQLTVGGNVVGTASNPQEVAALVDQANAISEQGGKTVDVRLQKEVQAATPTGEAYTAFNDVYANQPNNNGFLDTALPAALALMGGVGLPQLLGGGFLAAGLGAGLGSIAGSLGTGASLENALIKGGISGLTAGALSGLSAAAPVIGSKVGSAAGSAAGAGAAGAGAAGAGAAGAGAFTPLAGEILVQAARPVLSSALSSGLSAAGGSLLGEVGSSLVQPDPFKQALDQARVENQYAPSPVEEEILALGQRVAPTIPGTEALAAITGNALTAPLSPLDTATQPQQPVQPPGEPEIVVSNTALPKVDLTGVDLTGGLGAATGALNLGTPTIAPTSPLDTATQTEQPAPTQPAPAEPTITVTGALPTGGSPLDSVLSAAPDVIRFIADPSEVAGQIATQPAATEEPEIVVSNTATSPGGLNAAIATGAGGALNLGTNTPTDVSLPGEDLIDVVGDRIRPTGLSDLAPSALSELPDAKPTTYDPNETVVTGQRVTPATKDPTNLLASVGDAFVPAEVSGVEGKSLEQEQADPGEKKDSILSKVNPVRAGLSALAGIVSLLSGGGGGGRGVATGNAGAGTRASLDPIFSAKLPAPSPQYSGTSFAPRDMRGVDFARYGYGPGMSFFENVPRNPEEYKAALAANTRPARPSGALNLPPVAMPQTVGGTAADPTASATSLIRTFIPSATDAEIADFLATEEGIQFLANFGAPVRRARGGSMRGTGTSRNSYAVKGAGTGRSDEIPALLSDGEYVIDAETVAMLGDGSSEAGAKRLDDFRVKIRKHKGRNLAKGKFSANAKRPEKYLAGGRA